jgi:hypothetical protein
VICGQMILFAGFLEILAVKVLPPSSFWQIHYSHLRADRQLFINCSIPNECLSRQPRFRNIQEISSPGSVERVVCCFLRKGLPAIISTSPVGLRNHWCKQERSRLPRDNRDPHTHVNLSACRMFRAIQPESLLREHPFSGTSPLKLVSPHQSTPSAATLEANLDLPRALNAR